MRRPQVPFGGTEGDPKRAESLARRGRRDARSAQAAADAAQGRAEVSLVLTVAASLPATGTADQAYLVGGVLYLWDGTGWTAPVAVLG